MLVSIIVACNRIDNYLALAIESLINQTHRNIEVVFIANGPHRKEIIQIAKNIANNDQRFVFFDTPISQLSYCLNLGIEKSSGEYIARMDTDDISLPNRIEKQLAYLTKNNLDILGTSAFLINENGELIGERKPGKLNTIFQYHFFKSPIIHPSVIMKKSSIIKIRGYNSGFNSEDYDLWIRAIKNDLKIENMSECLIKYRLHKNSTQGSKLGYAEVAGYTLREFLLEKNIVILFAIFFNIIKYIKNDIALFINKLR